MDRSYPLNPPPLYLFYFPKKNPPLQLNARLMKLLNQVGESRKEAA